MTDISRSSSATPAPTSSVYGQCRPVSSFQKLGRIGEGTYGTVYKALDKDTKSIVALKRIIMHNEKHDGFPLTSIREIATLRRTNHPNCVKMLDVVVGHKRDGVFLVFEYCEHDISALLDHVRTPFSESEIKSLVYQLLSAVAYLHDHWIIHRDIKLSNLLYNNKGEVKLADFGLARTFPSHCQPPAAEKEGRFRVNSGGCGGSKRLFSAEVPMTMKVVTLWYRAPELLLGAETYCTAIDMWAVGCVLGELLLGRPLLPGDTELDQIHRIFALLGCPSARIWADLPTMKVFSNRNSESFPFSLNLSQEQERHPFSNLQAVFPCPSKIGDNGLECLNSMLTYDPKRRITARECRRHLYFSSSPHPKEPDMMPTFPCQHDDLQEPSGESLHFSGTGIVQDSSRPPHHVEDRGGGELVKEKDSRGVSSTSFASALACSYTVSSSSKNRRECETAHRSNRLSQGKYPNNMNPDSYLRHQSKRDRRNDSDGNAISRKRDRE